MAFFRNCLIHADTFIIYISIYLFARFRILLPLHFDTFASVTFRSFRSLNYWLFFFNESVNIQLFYWQPREFSLRNFVIAAARSEYDLHKLKGWLRTMSVESGRGSGRRQRENNRGEERGSPARIEISGDRPRFYSAAFPRSGLIHRADCISAKISEIITYLVLFVTFERRILARGLNGRDNYAQIQMRALVNNVHRRRGWSRRN